MIFVYQIIAKAESYGIQFLTGERCGVMMRLLFDVNEDGKKLLESFLDCKLDLRPPWNSSWIEGKERVGSIMLPLEHLNLLVAWGMLIKEEVVQVFIRDTDLIGIEAKDFKDPVSVRHIELLRRNEEGTIQRSFTRPQGTAPGGLTNVHQMSGRT